MVKSYTSTNLERPVLTFYNIKITSYKMFPFNRQQELNEIT